MNLLLCLSILAAVVEGAGSTARQLTPHVTNQRPPGHAPGGRLYVCKRAPQEPPVALRARVGDHQQIAHQPTKKAPPCPSLATTTACAFRK